MFRETVTNFHIAYLQVKRSEVLIETNSWNNLNHMFKTASSLEKVAK